MKRQIFLGGEENPEMGSPGQLLSVMACVVQDSRGTEIDTTKIAEVEAEVTGGFKTGGHGRIGLKVVKLAS
ncbi:unnamed protein product [Haemonchus placei]|uniref:Phage tail protein n=1 Tax=Haemonchus placei TaxID=6290 RepID=A0A0N4XAD8_HAEPC|nr:unnamed protein product [Haemonchus placei]